MKSHPSAPPPGDDESWPASTEPAGTVSSKMRLRRYLDFLQRLWWVPLITLLLGLALGAVNIHRTPPAYVSTARLWEAEKMKLPDGDAFAEDAQNYFGTQAELLRSGRLRALALQRLKGTQGQPSPVEVRVFPFPKTSIFVVEATGESQEFTPAFLDALLAEYQSYKQTVRNEISGETLASISDQMMRIQAGLRSDQEALAQFDRTNNVASMTQERAIAGSYAATLKTRLADYELDASLLESSRQEAERAAAGQTNAAADGLIDAIASDPPGQDPGLAARRDSSKNVEVLKLQRSRLARNLRPQHPKMVKLNQEIERAEGLVAIYRKQNQEQLESARRALDIKRARVEEAIVGWEKKQQEAARQLAESERLKSSINRSQALHDRLLAMLQTVDIRRNIERSGLAVLEPASPAQLAERREARKLGLSAFGGLALGLIAVFLVAYRDDRLTTSSEITENLGNAVLGQVPELGKSGAQGRIALLEDNDERHDFAESYRNLRSALLFSSVEGERPRVLLVTSAVPSEGKSTIAANLSRAIAMGGSRVLLVDGDLRKGRLHESLGLPRTPGLSEALREPDRLDSLIQHTTFPNLAFLCRGGNQANPGDLFLSHRFENLVGRLRERFDFVVVDSSPVFAADDSTTMAPFMDATLVVMRCFYSRAGEVREAIDLLLQRRAGILGLVVNRASSKGNSYRYKYPEYSTAFAAASP